MMEGYKLDEKCLLLEFYHILFSVQMLAKICLLLATIHWKNTLSLHTNFLITVLFKAWGLFTPTRSMCVYSPTFVFILVFWVWEFKYCGRESLACTWRIPCHFLQHSSSLLSPLFPSFFLSNLYLTWLSISHPQPCGLLSYLPSPLHAYRLHASSKFISLIFEFPESSTMLWHMADVHCFPNEWIPLWWPSVKA